MNKVLRLTDQKEWRKWLEMNHGKEKAVWLVYYNKKSGKARIAYNDAVEEALAFGWIDSTVKKLDENSSAQRFTPRNPKSGYSQANIERLRRLVAEGRVIPAVRKEVAAVLAKKFVFPPDIMAKIKANKTAWKNYRKFSPAYKRIRIGYIEGARFRPEEFKKRLDNFVKKTEKNKIFGFGGIEKYY
ncbi:MAG TPA: YdeI/OmpD-associated family protein [Candidatus Pacearchaeota archaeon]|nr:YdeI/OmpD-associated family protein [Candidatus Pacearchaeota archaeon]